MPRAPKKPERRIAERTLVLDNGGYTMKAGFASEEPSIDDCHVIPNCIAKGGGRSSKIYIADQLDSCREFGEMAFRRPLEKGFLVNWDSELDIWKHSFFDRSARLHCEPHETNLVLTEAPNCPQALQTNCDQMIFEEFEFASACRCLGPSLNAYNYSAEAVLVIDIGFSHTTVIPTLHSYPLHASIRHLSLGGKHLTNWLKEVISQRHINLMDESHIVSQIKEDACFVSQDFDSDLKHTWPGRARSVGKAQAATEDTITLDYVLPDYRTHQRGFTRPHDPTPMAVRIAAAQAASAQTGGVPQPREESFPLGNERFVVPELLFSPRDIALAQAGLPETVVQSLSSLPTGLWPAMLANVVVVGGTALTPGLKDRLEAELRAVTPSECSVRITLPEDPVRATWLGGARMASQRETLKEAVVTRAEYLEHGADWTRRKFGAGRTTTP